MMLGDMLAAARRSATGCERWLAVNDPALAKRLVAAAAAEAETPDAYIRVGIADFARFATEEDWASLVSRVRNAEDPGTACLVAMVEWRLTAFAREHGSPPPQKERPDE